MSLPKSGLCSTCVVKNLPCQKFRTRGENIQSERFGAFHLKFLWHHHKENKTKYKWRCGEKFCNLGRMWVCEWGNWTVTVLHPISQNDNKIKKCNNKKIICNYVFPYLDMRLSGRISLSILVCTSFMRAPQLFVALCFWKNNKSLISLFWEYIHNFVSGME